MHSPIFWLTGLSGSGKTTLATLLTQRLRAEGVTIQMLDGDVLREGLNSNLGFTETDRTENVRRTAEVAKLLSGAGVFTIVSLISPLRAHRDLARTIIGEKFQEVFVDAPLFICERRDPKGLYARARRGDLPNFTGISAKFEVPLKPDLWLETNRHSPEECVEELWAKLQGTAWSV